MVMAKQKESEWNNKLNLFCWWFNAELSDRGQDEAGKALKVAGHKFDISFTSDLTRANNTLFGIPKEIDQENIPIVKSGGLNERHYDGHTGLDKADTVAKYGEDQIKV